MNQKHVQHFISSRFHVDFSKSIASFVVSAGDIEEIVREYSRQDALSFEFIVATDDRKESGYFTVRYVFSVAHEHAYIVPTVRLKSGETLPSVASSICAAWDHERKLQDFFGIALSDQHRPKQILLHENWPTEVFPLRKDFAQGTRPKEVKGSYDFQVVAGEGIYEIPVGPIHAGIIEPGHFRFSVAGESIVQLEPRLGYVHKGIEKLFETLPTLPEKVHLSEKVSGDSSFSHSLAFCGALEQLCGSIVPKRGRYLRLVYAELERMANHFGDIGAIMLDTGFSFGGAHGARLREMILQIHEQLTGSRFLRGVNVVGGVTKDIDTKNLEKLLADIEKIEKDFSEVVEIAQGSASLLNRMKDTGKLSLDIAKDMGVVGVVARASGIAKDTRVDFPYAAYDEVSLDCIENEVDGDVHARFRVRVKEIFASFDLLRRALSHLPSGPISLSSSKCSFEKDAFAIQTVEGWRGSIIYFVATDQNGMISRVSFRDPSFVNWPSIADAAPDNIIPDFPLINKSFNLSYSGNDM